MLVTCASPQPNARLAPELIGAAFDGSGLRDLAKHHGLLAPLAKLLRENAPLQTSEILVSWREELRSQAILALSLTAEMILALARFADLGIEALVTKGPVLSARCYGEPGQRQYSDIDLIVREKDMQRVTEAMTALRYSPRVPLRAIQASKFPGEYVFRKPDTQLLIEFHTERTFRYHPEPLPIEKLFQRSTFVGVDLREIPALSVEDELVLISIHGAKHFWAKLMWIADVAALISRQSLDWDRAFTIAREVGADRMLRLGLGLAMNVLGAIVPQQIAAEAHSDRAVRRLTRQIIRQLQAGEPESMGLLERAAFRVKMRGSLLPGLAYLLRLTLSPTEEDWTPEKEGSRPLFLDAISRPLRLAKKHARPSSK